MSDASPDVPSIGQLAMLSAGALSFAIAGIVALRRALGDDAKLRLVSRTAVAAGLICSVAVLIWHDIVRGSWVPLEDNFDALIWLAVLLAGFVQYTQRSKPLGGIEWFAMPLVTTLLVAAGVFGRAMPREYFSGAWQWTHRVTAFGGLATLAIGGVSGAMYLVKLRQLRTHQPVAGPRIASLERLEHVTYTAVTLGFALLTVGLLTGLILVIAEPGGLGTLWFLSPKVLLAFSVWLIYALVLHAPVNPSFRGRRAALLSVFGLVLTIGTLVAVQYVPAGVGSRPASVSGEPH